MSTLKSWKRFSKWLEMSAPSLAASLLPGVDAAELAAFEKEVGATLPASVRELWSACSGQKELDGPGVAGDFVLLSPRTALAEWRRWAELRSESSEEAREELASACSSHPPGAIREAYSVAGWIPLWKERMEGNFLGVDVDPGPKGVVGQVIGFGRDEDDKRVLFWDYAAALAWLADQADDGALSFADDRLEHRDGRILSVLTSLAEDGALPPGKKPKTTRPKQPKSKPEKKKAAAPAPVPDRLPEPAQAALDTYIGLLLDALGRHAKKLPQPEAVSQQRADDPAKPMGSLIGSPLEMVPNDPPMDFQDHVLRKPFSEVLQKSLEAGLPLSQIRIELRREGSGWSHQVSIETAENRKRLTSARQPRDAELVAALIAFMDKERADWESATLGFDERPDVARSGLTVVSLPKPIAVVAPSDELRALFDGMQSLHAQFGRKLRYATWRVARAKPDKPDVRTVYG